MVGANYPPSFSNSTPSRSQPIRSNAYDSDDDDEPNPPSTKRPSTTFLISKSAADSSSSTSLLIRTREFIRVNEGFLLIALSQGFFALINCFVKLMNEISPTPTWEVIWIRMMITWIGCYTYMRATGIPDALFGPPGTRLLLSIRGATGFFGLFGIYFSLQYLSLSDATTLTFLSPILCGILAYLVLEESYSKTEAMVGVISLLGVILVAKPSFIFSEVNKAIEIGPDGKIVTAAQRNVAIIVAMLGCCGAAGAYVSIRKIGKKAHALHVIAFFSLYCVFVASFYPIIFDSPPVLIFTWQFFLLLNGIGICGFVAQGLLTLGLQREKAGRGALAVYANILFTLILEKTVFGKLPDTLSFIGASIIVGGGIFTALEKGRKTVAAVIEESKLEEGRGDEGDGVL